MDIAYEICTYEICTCDVFAEMKQDISWDMEGEASENFKVQNNSNPASEVVANPFNGVTVICRHPYNSSTDCCVHYVPSRELLTAFPHY